MILIITHKQDYTADFLINKLNASGTIYLRLNCEDLLFTPNYQLSDEGGFEFRLTGFNSVTHVEISLNLTT